MTIKNASMGDAEAGEFHNTLLAAFGCVIPPREATYVSTPITTGRHLLAWRTSAPEVTEGTADYRRALELNVIEPNISSAKRLVEFVRQRVGGIVIDPTALEQVPQWEQFHYHALWVDVITRFARQVVFAEGWAYSVGCALELEAASTHGLVLLDHELVPITMDQGIEALDDATNELRSAGVVTTSFDQVVDRLRVLKTAS